MEKESPDNLLIEQFKNGDTGAFEEIVRRYREKACGLAYNLTGSREDAEDISQEAFAIVYRKITAFRGEASFRTWFYRIVVNLCNSHLRRRKWIKMIGFGLGNEDTAVINEISIKANTGAGITAENIKLKRAIDDAVKALSRQQREVFVMRHFHEMKLGEIARCLNCAEGTVKAHLFRAIRNLQERLKDFAD